MFLVGASFVKYFSDHPPPHFCKIIVFTVSFSQASRMNSFFPFVVCPSKVGPVSCVYGEICAEVFFFLIVVCLLVCFSSDGQG